MGHQAAPATLGSARGWPGELSQCVWGLCNPWLRNIGKAGGKTPQGPQLCPLKTQYQTKLSPCLSASAFESIHLSMWPQVQLCLCVCPCLCMCVPVCLCASVRLGQSVCTCVCQCLVSKSMSVCSFDCVCLYVSLCLGI